jgi:hypothetical protein
MKESRGSELVPDAITQVTGSLAAQKVCLSKRSLLGKLLIMIGNHLKQAFPPPKNALC